MNNWYKNPLQIFILIVVVAAMAMVTIIGLAHFGVVLPAAFQKIFWICVGAFFIIAALMFLASLASGWWKNPPSQPPTP